MIFSTSIISLLAAKTFASPVANSLTDLVSRSPASGEVVPNFERWVDDAGNSRVRFKRGMEPDSADYARRMTKAKAKRDDTYPQTQITVGDATIWWGCDIDPSVAIGNLSSVCQPTGACVSNAPYTLPVIYVTDKGGIAQDGATLTLSAVGDYPARLQPTLITAMQTAANAPNMITWDRGQKFGGNNVNKRDTAPQVSPTDFVTNGPEGTCDIAKFPSFYSLAILSDADTLSGHIDLTTTLPDLTGGFCKQIGDMAAFTAGIAGMFAAGAPIAGALGVIQAGCNSGK